MVEARLWIHGSLLYCSLYLHICLEFFIIKKKHLLKKIFREHQFFTIGGYFSICELFVMPFLGS